MLRISLKIKHILEHAILAVLFKSLEILMSFEKSATHFTTPSSAAARITSWYCNTIGTYKKASFTFFNPITPKRNCIAMILGMGASGFTSIATGTAILAGGLNIGLLSGTNGLIFAGLSTAAASTGIGLIILGIVLVVGALWCLKSLYGRQCPAFTAVPFDPDEEVCKNLIHELSLAD